MLVLNCLGAMLSTTVATAPIVLKTPVAVRAMQATTSLYLVTYNDGYVPGDESGSQGTATVETPVTDASSDDTEVEDEDPATPEQEAQSLCGTYGGTVAKSFSDVGGFAANMTAAQAQAMAGDPRVQSVELDAAMELAGTQQLSDSPSFGNWQWGIDSIDQTTGRNFTYGYTSTGSNVHVFVVDSGIWTANSDLGGRATMDKNVVDATQPATDDYGHGTWIASIIGGTEAGVAKGVAMHSVKVTNGLGDLKYSNVAAGLDWVLANYKLYSGRAVVHCSAVGGSTLTGASLVTKAVNKLLDKGIPVIVPAGNRPQGSNGVNVSTIVPANQPRALTVGGAIPISPGQTEVPDMQRVTEFNYGSGIDVFAPSVRVKMATWGIQSDGSRYSTFNFMSGTSAAAPFVTGTVARFLQANPKATLAQINAYIVNNAKPRMKATGLQSPNRFLYVPATL